MSSNFHHGPNVFAPPRSFLRLTACDTSSTGVIERGIQKYAEICKDFACVWSSKGGDSLNGNTVHKAKENRKAAWIIWWIPYSRMSHFLIWVSFFSPIASPVPWENLKRQRLAVGPVSAKWGSLQDVAAWLRNCHGETGKAQERPDRPARRLVRG